MKNNYVTCDLMGGLGNQLFQLFTTICYAKKYKKEVLFLDTKKLGNRETYWSSLFSYLQPFLTKGYEKIDHLYCEKSFDYEDIPSRVFEYSNVMICGYFQSPKYFHEFFPDICCLISLQTKKEDTLERIFQYHNPKLLQNSVSLHFRLGDYKKITEYHPIQSCEYYSKALASLVEQEKDKIQNVIYFCEEEDIETIQKTIEILQEQFSELRFERATNELQDWEQLLFMSCCTHNIIANSTFSWWGAYFNTNPQKKVYYPSVWFGEVSKHNVKDLCPVEWIKI